MISAVVSSILDRYLKDYIENFDSKALSISLLSGKVTLNNLLVKPYALDHIYPDVPFIVSKGNLKQLKLDIPWQKLKSESVVCEVTGLSLVLKPKKEYEWDEKMEQEKQANLKQSALQKYEMQKKLIEQFQKSEEEKLKKESEKSGTKEKKEKKKKKKGKVKKIPIFETLIETILNNIVIKINRVFIRYEDNIKPERRFSFTMNVGSVKIVSTNDKWEDQFSTKVGDITHKLVKLDGFSVYMNVNDGKQRYLFPPTKGELKLRMQSLSRSIDLSKPIFQGEIDIDSINLNISDIQYKCFMSLIDYAGSFTKFEKYRKYRPRLTLPPTIKGAPKIIIKGKERAKKWWKFAYNCITERKRKKSSAFKLAAMFKARDRYIELYKMYAGVRWYNKITKNERQEMKDFEFKNEIKTIVLYRTLARFEMDRQNEIYDYFKETDKRLKKQVEDEKKTIQKDNLKFLFKKRSKKEKEWIKQRKIQKELLKNSMKKTIGPEDLIFSPDQKLLVYKKGFKKIKQFDLSIDQIKKAGADQDKKGKGETKVVQLQMKVKLDDLKLCLKKYGGNEGNQSIAEAHFGKFFSLISLEKGGFHIDMKMNKFEILDHNKTVYPIILFPSPSIGTLPSPSSMKALPSPPNTSTPTPTQKENIEQKDLLSIKIIKKDKLVKFLMFLEQMSFVLNLELIKKVVSFFIVDEIPNFDNFELLDQIKLQQAAKKKRKDAELKKNLEDSDSFDGSEEGSEEGSEDSNDISEHSDVGNELALVKRPIVEEEKTQIEVHIDAKAPVIYFPISCEVEGSEYLFLDLGRIKFVKLKEQGNYNLNLNNLQISFPKKTKIFDPVIVTKENRIIQNLDLQFTLEHLKNQKIKVIPQKEGEKEDDLKLKKEKGTIINLKLIENNEIDLFVSPEKGQFLLKLINKVSEFSSNPFLGDNLIHDTMEVKGPISDEQWKLYFVELNSALKRINFCEYTTNKGGQREEKRVIGFLKLGNGVELINKIKDPKSEEDEDNYEGFEMILGKSNGRKMKFHFKIPEKSRKTKFYRAINSINLKVFNSKRKKREKEQQKKEKEQTSKEIKESKTKKPELDMDEDEDEDEFQEKKEKLDVNLDGYFNKISVHLTDNKMKELVQVELDDIKMAYNNNSGVFNTILPKAKIIGENDITIAQLNKLDVSIGFQKDSEKSEKQESEETEKGVQLDDQGREINVVCAFEDVKIHMHQSVVKVFINFLYDLIDVYDELDMKKQSFKQDKEKDEVSNLATNIVFKLGKIEVSVINMEKVKLLTFFMNRSMIKISNTKELVTLSCVFNDTIITNEIIEGIYPTLASALQENESSPVQKSENSVIKFGFELNKFAKALTSNSKVEIEVNNLKYVHLHPIITKCLDYSLKLLEEIIIRERKRFPLKQEKESTPPTYFFSILIDINNVSFFVPVSSYSEEGIIAVCKNLRISNTVKHQLIQIFTIESNTIKLFQVKKRTQSVKAIEMKSKEKETQKDLEDLDYIPLTYSKNDNYVGFKVDAFVVSRELDRMCLKPSLEVKVEVPELEIIISPLQINLISQCLLKNLASGISSLNLSLERKLGDYLLELKQLLLNKVSTVEIDPSFIKQIISVSLGNIKLILTDSSSAKILQLQVSDFSFLTQVQHSKAIFISFKAKSCCAKDIQKSNNNQFRSLIDSNFLVSIQTPPKLTSNDETTDKSNKETFTIKGYLDHPHSYITSSVVFELFKFVMECRFQDNLKTLKILQSNTQLDIKNTSSISKKKEKKK